MASKIIPFRRPSQAVNAQVSLPRQSVEDRVKALPEWMQELNVDWIFKEADRRQGGPQR